MVGSSVVRALLEEGYQNIVTQTRSDLDLTDQSSVRAFYEAESVDYVVIAAAKVVTFYHNGIERRLTNVHGEVLREIIA